MGPVTTGAANSVYSTMCTTSKYARFAYTEQAADYNPFTTEPPIWCLECRSWLVPRPTSKQQKDLAYGERHGIANPHEAAQARAMARGTEARAPAPPQAPAVARPPLPRASAASCYSKRAYPSEITANEVIRARQAQGAGYLRAYACPACGRFHLTSALLWSTGGKQAG